MQNMIRSTEQLNYKVQKLNRWRFHGFCRCKSPKNSFSAKRSYVNKVNLK